MIASIPSATLLGVDGFAVSVEVHVSTGLPAFTIVGLPDAACREARDRVRAAIMSSGLNWPLRRVTVNLAPSELRKAGSGLDLAMAIGLLTASGELSSEAVRDIAFVGELGLDGSVRTVDGIVPLVSAVTAASVVVAHGAAAHAGLARSATVRAALTLSEIVHALRGERSWSPPPVPKVAPRPPVPDMADVRGQPLARWAVEVAAAGGHNLLLIGPPGAGKTMLAARLPGILPDLDAVDAQTCTRIHSAGGHLDREVGLLTRPPFRAPHHSASMVSLIGGGSGTLRPGEASLAHGGVLFLDEMGEFPRRVLDALRQPVEEGAVRVTRAQASVIFPAEFLLVGATNPCPCGEGGTPATCQCSDGSRQRYTQRLSAPLLDRFDLRVYVPRPQTEQFFSSSNSQSESSGVIAERVNAARARAVYRGVAKNAQLNASTLDAVAPLTRGAAALLSRKMENGSLTARGLYRVRRVALTLADLDGSNLVDDSHVSAALELRAERSVLAVAS